MIAMIDSSAWYVMHRPTDRISGAFSSPDSAIAGAKTLGSRTAKFQQIGDFSGRPLFATKTGWLVVPGSYVISLQNTGNMPHSEFEATTAARRTIEHVKNRSGGVAPRSFTFYVPTKKQADEFVRLTEKSVIEGIRPEDEGLDQSRAYIIRTWAPWPRIRSAWRKVTGIELGKAPSREKPQKRNQTGGKVYRGISINKVENIQVGYRTHDDKRSGKGRKVAGYEFTIDGYTKFVDTLPQAKTYIDNYLGEG